MDVKETLLGSRGRMVGSAIGAIVLLIGVLFLGGVLGFPGVTDIQNGFGTVNDSTTVVETDITVNNPNPFALPVGGVGVDYSVTMNDIAFGEGQKDGIGLPAGESSFTLRTYLNNSKIPAWWVSHIRNDEQTAVEVSADISTGIGYSMSQKPVDRTLRTDILGTFNTTEDQPVNANAPFVEDPVVVIRQRNATFGEVSRSETPIEITFVVYNPKNVPIVLSELDYDMTMNDVDVGEGQTSETYVIEPKSTEQIETTARLKTTRLDEWWVSHLQNDQVTRLFIDFSARLSVEGLGATTVPMEGLDYETFFETDFFATKNQTSGNGGSQTSTDDGGTATMTTDGTDTATSGTTTTTSEDESSPTTTTAEETTAADEETTTTEDDGILAVGKADGITPWEGGVLQATIV